MCGEAKEMSFGEAVAEFQTKELFLIRIYMIFFYFANKNRLHINSIERKKKPKLKRRLFYFCFIRPFDRGGRPSSIINHETGDVLSEMENNLTESGPLTAQRFRFGHKMSSITFEMRNSYEAIRSRRYNTLRPSLMREIFCLYRDCSDF